MYFGRDGRPRLFSQNGKPYQHSRIRREEMTNRKMMLAVLTATVMLFGVGGSAFVQAQPAIELSKIDKNQDGKVSFKEYTDAYIEGFEKLDANGDEYLTKEEIRGAVQAGETIKDRLRKRLEKPTE
jgi:Ca2+-binding EF-hand superfamily protein